MKALVALLLLCCAAAHANPNGISAQGRASVGLARNVYSSTNVTTSAYVQLIASTSDTTNEICLFDSSGQTMVLAVGASGFEVNQFYVFPGGQGCFDGYISKGSRLSIKAISATASTGELDVYLLK